MSNGSHGGFAEFICHDLPIRGQLYHPIIGIWIWKRSSSPTMAVVGEHRGTMRWDEVPNSGEAPYFVFHFDSEIQVIVQLDLLF